MRRVELGSAARLLWFSSLYHRRHIREEGWVEPSWASFLECSIWLWWVNRDLL